MPDQTYPLDNARPAQLSGSDHDGFTLYNAGTVVVYVSDNPRVRAAAGFPLKPGASQIWDAGRDCWAIGAAVGAELIKSDNTGPITDPAAIATALTDSGLSTDIAADIVASGLAAAIAGDIDAAVPAHTAQQMITQAVHTAIANAIAASTLAGDTGTRTAQQIIAQAIHTLIANAIDGLVPAHTAQQMITQGVPQAHATAIATTGAPPIDNPAVIVPTTGVINVPDGLGGFYPSPYPATFDVSTAQTLVIYLTWSSFGAAPSATASQFVELVAAWDVGGGHLGQETHVALAPYDDRGASTIYLPVKGVGCSLRLTNRAGAAVGFTSQVLRSSRSIPRPVVDQINWTYVTATGVGLWDPQAVHPALGRVATPLAHPLALPGGAGNMAWIPPRAGEIQVTLVPDAVVSTTARFGLLDHLGNGIVAGAMNAAANLNASILTLDAIVGNHPVFLRQLAAGAGPTHVSVSASWRD